MTLRLASLLAVALFAVSSVQAAFTKLQDFKPLSAEEAAMTADSSGAETSAVILNWVRVDDDAASFSTEYLRIKILTDAGKKYADIEIPYSPSYPVHGRITDISARTIRPDGTIAPFSGKIYDKVLIKAGRASLRSKTFSLPDVQAGSIIEYRFVRRWSESLLLNTHWAVQRDIPILRAHLTLKPYASNGDFTSFFTYSGLPAGKVPEKIRDRYELELENMPPLQAEAFAPPEEQMTARVNFYYSASRVRPDEFWNLEAARLNKSTESFIGKSAAAAAVARTVVRDPEDPTAGLKQIYRYVQNLRNYSFESVGEQEVGKQKIAASRNVEEVLRKNAGFRDEINRVFVAIARAAGYDADAVRVAPRDARFFTDRIPDGGQMEGEVVVVSVGSDLLYLDPGTPHAPFGILSWEKSSVRGIRLTRGGKPEWVTLPMVPPAAAETRRHADLRLEDDTLIGTLTITFTGQEALVRRLRAMGSDQADRTEELENEIKRWFPDGSTLKETQVTGFTGFDEPLVVTAEVTLPNLATRAGTRVAIPVGIFASTTRNPFAPATRVNPVYFHYSSREEDEVSVRLPAGTTMAALPGPTELSAGSLGYRNELSRVDGGVVIKRSMFVDVMLVETSYYDPLRTFYSSVIAADQKPVVVTLVTQ